MYTTPQRVQFQVWLHPWQSYTHEYPQERQKLSYEIPMVTMDILYTNDDDESM